MIVNETLIIQMNSKLTDVDYPHSSLDTIGETLALSPRSRFHLAALAVVDTTVMKPVRESPSGFYVPYCKASHLLRPNVVLPD